MRKTFAAAEYVFKQSFRNKMLNVLIIFAVMAMGFSFFISELAQEVEMKMIKDFGLFAINIFAFLTLALSLTIQMFEETELKTLFMVIVKPIKRSEFIIGKYLGIIATIGMNMLLMFITLMIIIAVKGGNPWDIDLFVSVVMTFAGIAVLSSAGLLFSVIATSVPGAVIYLFLVYVLGHITVHLKNIVDKLDSVLLKVLTDIMYYLVPNLQLFNFKDRITSGLGGSDAGYAVFVVLYAVSYIAVMLVITGAVFKRKEFF
ncbi:MAG: ABC transporter permease [Candidatus Goldiibacteriota bacterium]